MEFTKTEIEMFGKAKELQADWKPQVGDWFYKPDGLGYGNWLICRILGGTLWCAGEGMKRPEFGNRLVEFRVPESYTWIPSLSKLLGMVLDSSVGVQDIGRILMEFNFSAGGAEIGISEYVSRIRLMFLGLVMRERYNRRWDGKTWRKLSAPKKADK